jgi:hypothetical protein
MADEVVTRDNVTRTTVRPGLRIGEVLNRVSWGAIWAGVMVALGMEALFTLFGVFIGFDFYNATAANPWGGAAIWTTAWYLVTAGWSMFIGAWSASKLAGSPDRGIGVLHGMATWGLATFSTIVVVAVTAWAVLRAGIVLLASGAAAPAGTGFTAQGTADAIVGIAGRVWGGVMLGLITAYIGGIIGRPGRASVEVQETPASPTRIAA